MYKSRNWTTNNITQNTCHEFKASHPSFIRNAHVISLFFSKPKLFVINNENITKKHPK